MKYVTDYHIEAYGSGIIEIIINTTERWLYYHRLNDYNYTIAKNRNETRGELEKYILEISKEELGLKEGASYINAHSQEKDQIVYYFIPLNLITQE